MTRSKKYIFGAGSGFAFGLLAAALLSGDLSVGFLDQAAPVDSNTLLGITLISLVFFYVAYFLQIMLHEGGHLVCGLATGYTFVSFRIRNLTLIRKDGRFVFKRYGIAGTGGQCLLAPPPGPLERIPTAWYLMGGVLANLLSAAIALILVFRIGGMPSLVVAFLVIFGLVGCFFALMNGIPMKIGGIANDADNMRLLRRKPESKEALMTQLRVNALMQEGVRLRDMPSEWFREEENTDYGDALQTTVRLMAASRYEDLGDMDNAYRIFSDCMRHKDELLGLFVRETACELLLIALVKGYTEQIDELYTEELKTYIDRFKTMMPSKQALLCALALCKEDDRDKAVEIYETLCRERDRYLLQGEVQMSLALMQSILKTGNVSS